jgi:CRP-like cAMP-binding protein
MRPCSDNQLLAGLSGDELGRLEPDLVQVVLQQDLVLCGDGRPVTHVYFPTSSLVSVLCSTSAGDSMDVAVIGAEGVIGLTFSASGEWLPGRVVVQCSGEAWRLPVAALRQEFAHGGSLQRWCCYHQLLMAQMAQAAVQPPHRVDQQLCRWILASLDRTGGDRLETTQQQVARMLGVRREAVSAAASRLEDQGVLHWGRGRLHVLDRVALQAHSCECYQALRCQAQGLFPFMRRAA